MLEESPVQRVGPFVMFAVGGPMYYTLVSSTLLVERLVRKGVFFSLAQVLRKEGRFFQIRPARYIGYLSRSSDVRGMDVDPRLWEELRGSIIEGGERFKVERGISSVRVECV